MPHLPHRSRKGRNGFQGSASFVQGRKFGGKFAHCCISISKARNTSVSAPWAARIAA
jgi:hypothetical protein